MGQHAGHARGPAQTSWPALVACALTSDFGLLGEQSSQKYVIAAFDADEPPSKI